MTAATTITKSTTENGPIRSRTEARIVVAFAVTLIAGVGLWGAFSVTESVRAYQQTKRVESAVEHARYEVALERTAIRDPGTNRARRALAGSAAAFATDLRRIRRDGAAGDATRAAFLGERHQALLDAASDVFSAQTAGAASVAIARNAFEAEATALDRVLNANLAVVRARSSDSWPAETTQKVELAATALLVVVGLSSCVILLMRLAGQRRRLERARHEEFKRLERAALTDSLTGLSNHRAFYEDLKLELARRARTGSCFSIVMLDLDRLKEVNDTLGHRAGDERIKAVAECLSASLRDGDGAYRTGGDEFMALLPNERAWGALTFAQRVQAEIARHPKVLRVSCGLAETSGLESDETLVHHADLALYEAKRSGRRTVVYSDALEPKPTLEPEYLASRRHQQLLATALAQAVDAKDAGTRNHCETVSTLCVLIGQELALTGDRIEHLETAGLLHDVGKIGIADVLLQKKGKLTREERIVMNNHVYMGQSIVAAAGLDQEAEWILRHHEHLDGRGYPDGLSGTDIPLESRIIGVADAFEAMTATRPYSPARSAAEAFEELDRGTGTQFDGDCVGALRAALGSSLEAPLGRLAQDDDRNGSVPAPVAQVATGLAESREMELNTQHTLKLTATRAEEG